MNTSHIFLSLYFFYLFTIPSITSNTLCLSFISQHLPQSALIEKIKENITELIIDENKSDFSNCITSLITSENYEALEVYLQELAANGVKYREKLTKSINQIEANLNSILYKFSFEENDYEKVIPALQWAQSLDSVFIEVKFAHRHDSPGCLEISKLNITYTNETVSLVGYCVLGDVPIKFELNLNMYRSILDKNSTYESGSVGRAQITLKKESNGYWKQLTSDGVEKTNPNMRVWFEMKAKYEEELKHFEEINEDEEFKESYNKLEEEYRKKKEEKKKRRKKKKSKKKTNTTTTEEAKKDNKKTDL